MANFDWCRPDEERLRARLKNLPGVVLGPRWAPQDDRSTRRVAIALVIVATLKALWRLMGLFP